MRDIIFFLRDYYFLSHFKGLFEGSKKSRPPRGYGMALNAIGLLEDFFALLWTSFTFALFTIAFIIITATFIAVILAMAALVRYKRRGNFPFFRDPQRDLQHRRRHTRTRAKSCPKQCCYKPQVMQPPATLGMWK